MPQIDEEPGQTIAEGQSFKRTQGDAAKAIELSQKEVADLIANPTEVIEQQLQALDPHLIKLSKDEMKALLEDPSAVFETKLQGLEESSRATSFFRAWADREIPPQIMEQLQSQMKDIKTYTGMESGWRMQLIIEAAQKQSIPLPEGMSSETFKKLFAGEAPALSTREIGERYGMFTKALAENKFDWNKALPDLKPNWGKRVIDKGRSVLSAIAGRLVKK